VIKDADHGPPETTTIRIGNAYKTNRLSSHPVAKSNHPITPTMDAAMSRVNHSGSLLGIVARLMVASHYHVLIWVLSLRK
jgi:hypothetical protein